MVQYNCKILSINCTSAKKRKPTNSRNIAKQRRIANCIEIPFGMILWKTWKKKKKTSHKILLHFNFLISNASLSIRINCSFGLWICTPTWKAKKKHLVYHVGEFNTFAAWKENYYDKLVYLINVPGDSGHFLISNYLWKLPQLTRCTFNYN